MTIERPPSLLQRWSIFLNERFSLFTHLPMVLLLVAANVALSIDILGTDRDVGSYLYGSILACCFLFRLRCFDELKDYATDCSSRPTRPLPRGLLTVREVKRMIAWLTGVELVIAGLAGGPVLVTHGIAVCYSFLMYREFFIGAYLQPRLTAYAVTHTFSAVLLGYSLASLTSGQPVWQFKPAILVFGLANWMLFNVFEFARKTFAPADEGPGVDSYSSRYHPGGATALTISQIAIALGVIRWLQAEILLTPVLFHGAVLIAGVVLLTGIVYTVRPRRAQATTYRAAASAFLLLFYALMAWGCWSL